MKKSVAKKQIKVVRKGLSRMFGINHNTINNIFYNKNRFKGV